MNGILTSLADAGNFYSSLWDSSSAVAEDVGTPEALSTIVADINAHHAIFAGPDVPYPVWLQEVALNQVRSFRGACLWQLGKCVFLLRQISHAHMMIWSRDGRMREFEAFSCDDVDSIHNDYQRVRTERVGLGWGGEGGLTFPELHHCKRATLTPTPRPHQHLIYLWTMPEFERQKLIKWASGQAADGHIQVRRAGVDGTRSYYPPLDVCRVGVSRRFWLGAFRYARRAHHG